MDICTGKGGSGVVRTKESTQIYQQHLVMLHTVRGVLRNDKPRQEEIGYNEFEMKVSKQT